MSSLSARARPPHKSARAGTSSKSRVDLMTTSCHHCSVPARPSARKVAALPTRRYLLSLGVRDGHWATARGAIHWMVHSIERANSPSRFGFSVLLLQQRGCTARTTAYPCSEGRGGSEILVGSGSSRRQQGPIHSGIAARSPNRRWQP